MPDSSQAITTILGKVDKALTGFVETGYSALVTDLSAALQLILIIFTAMIGFLILFNKADISMKTGIMLFLKALIIYVLVTQWSYYSINAMDLFSDSPQEIITSLLSVKSSNQANLNGSLTQIFDKGFEIANNIREQGGMTALGPLFYSLGVIILNVMLVGYIVFLLVLAKVGVGLLLILGPIFIPMLLFSSTRGLFQAWLGYLINFAIIPIFVYLMLVLLVNIISDPIDLLLDKMDAGKEVNMAEIAPYILISVISFLLFTQVRSLTKGIGNGMMQMTASITEKVSQKVQIAQRHYQTTSRHRTAHVTQVASPSMHPQAF